MYFMRINSNKREKLRTWKLFCLRKNPEEGHSSKPGLPGVNSVKGEEGLVHGRKGRGLCAGISEIQGLMSLTFIRVIITGITALIWRPWHARFYLKHSFKLLIFVSVLRQLHFSLMQPVSCKSCSLTNKKNRLVHNFRYVQQLFYVLIKTHIKSYRHLHNQCLELKRIS